MSEAAENVQRRLDAALAVLGLTVDAETRSRWVAAVAAVQAELAQPLSGRVSGAPAPVAPADEQPAGSSRGDRSPPPVQTADDSPWVWQPAKPLAALGSGPLDGLRLAVKDLVALAGRPMGAGSAVRAGVPPEARDAAVVRTLRQAGARIVGSVKLHEFAFGVSGINPFAGTPANPAAPGRIPGGSSSGSAAVVAAGLAEVALGTDTGGSCRIPAACCGVVGFKPSYGRVELDGVFALAPSLDHVGWLSVDVAAAAAVAAATGLVAAGEVEGTLRTGDPPRVGVARAAVSAADPEVREAFEDVAAALTAQGWQLVDLPWPESGHSFAPSTAIMFSEAAHVHRATLARRPGAYGADVRARLLQGQLFDLSTYLSAQERRDGLRGECRRLLGGVDAVIGPTLPLVAPTLQAAADPTVAARLVSYTRLANLTGFPALSIPIPNRPVPIGMQIEGSTDSAVLRVGAAMEVALRRRL